MGNPEVFENSVGFLSAFLGKSPKGLFQGVFPQTTIKDVVQHRCVGSKTQALENDSQVWADALGVSVFFIINLKLDGSFGWLF